MLFDSEREEVTDPDPPAVPYRAPPAVARPDSDAAIAAIGTGTVAVAAATALGACGGGSDGGAAATPAPPPAPAVTDKEAARFAAHASMGTTAADIARIQGIGLAAWLDEQFNLPRSTGIWDWLVTKGYNDPSFINTQQGIDAALWRSLITGSDTLRQRVALALSELMVVGIDGLNVSWKPFVAAAYMDLLLDNAFGNFRTLLQAVSTSPAMGIYLTFRGNVKANASTGSMPDENYARESMQLFTIGLYELNSDGTLKLTGGKPKETYTQDDIIGLARVFTGWDLDSSSNTTPDRMRRPMTQVTSRHEPGEKKFLGTTIAAGTDGVKSLALALDTLFAHPNVAPFVGRQLIQRLVTSNPSASYVSRVAASFADNGSQVRGDLKAVIKAILLDDEARNAAGLADPVFGKLREPVLRFTAWARAFSAASPSDTWPVGNTSDPAARLGQSPVRSGSVFNFFRPGYVPPNSPIGTANLVAPELQITNESSVVGYVNFMQATVGAGVGDVKADYTAWLPLVATPAALLDQLNLVLAAGQLGASTLSSIIAAISAVSMTTDAGKLNRLYAAITLVLAAPEFITQK